MPLEVLFIGVLLGVTGVVWLVHATGGSSIRRFADEADATARWSFDHPAETVANVILSDARTAALVDTDRGAGLMWSFEAEVVSHPLERAALRRITPHPRGLRVEFTEFTTPATTLALTGAEAATWTAYLSRFVRN